MGICYGMQLIGGLFGGKVHHSKKREYGKAVLIKKKNSQILSGVKQNSVVWMSHQDKVVKRPKDFDVIASTENCNYCIIQHRRKPIIGMQFHPEVYHTVEGDKLLKNFVFKICKVKPDWTMGSFIISTGFTLRR